jgi:dTDP-4-amino-4,6-dideoxygalactose transaminase
MISNKYNLRIICSSGEIKIIKLFSPHFDSNEINAAINTIKSGNWASGSGINKVKEFEENFQKMTNSKTCLAVDSGTAALELALSLFDLKNKEVLVPSLTFISTINAIMFNGGKPVFVDVEPETLNFDPVDAEKKITSKTKIILPVHFGGLPINIKKISKIARKNKLLLITDAAHACGAKIGQQKIGSEGDCVCFSFHPVKNLAMPKGGAITINLKNFKKYVKIVKSLRWCGIDNRRDVKYDVTRLGHNYYMDEISASIGIIQLKKLESMNEKRYSIAKKYFNGLKVENKMPLIKGCSYHLYWILSEKRDKLREFLYSKEIESGIHYQPAHKMSIYKTKIKLPVTEQISKKIVTLPIHTNLNRKNIDYIIKMVNSF